MRLTQAIITLMHILTSSYAQDSSAHNATEAALQYRYPQLAFRSFSLPILEGLGANYLNHARFLSTAANWSVVKPNTLYSTLLFDLSRIDLVITVPEVPTSQYALFSYYDPFGGNFEDTGGSCNFNASGEYRLRPRPEGSKGYGLDTSTGNDIGSYAAYVNSPTTYGIVIIRWLVDASSYDAVNAYQDAASVQTIARENGNSSTFLATANCNRGNSTPAEHVLNLLAELAPANPSIPTSEIPIIDATLTIAGISNGSYTPPTNLSLASANSSAIAAAGRAGLASRVPLNNGWSTTGKNRTGNFGANYAFRTAMAAAGYLGLVAPDAIYPSWTNASDGSQILSLGEDDCYIYTFSRKPPLQRLGFWSFAAHGEDNFLIDNPRDALGDRSKFTCASGQLVYGGSHSSSDGSFQILVQAADVTPPANWTSNWLPGPSGGGNLSALLRWYGAEEHLLDGKYEYPVVTSRLLSEGMGRLVTAPSPHQRQRLILGRPV